MDGYGDDHNDGEDDNIGDDDDVEWYDFVDSGPGMCFPRQNLFWYFSG